LLSSDVRVVLRLFLLSEHGGRTVLSLLG
jgi:hypothetical protein